MRCIVNLLYLLTLLLSHIFIRSLVKLYLLLLSFSLSLCEHGAIVTFSPRSLFMRVTGSSVLNFPSLYNSSGAAEAFFLFSSRLVGTFIITSFIIPLLLDVYAVDWFKSLSPSLSLSLFLHLANNTLVCDCEKLLLSSNLSLFLCFFSPGLRAFYHWNEMLACAPFLRFSIILMSRCAVHISQTTCTWCVREAIFSTLLYTRWK